ncbi:MAG: hypothetical protein KTR15_16310 [Phycisphaeraceae bacterium]|nr:hypothetical protein [Phycisphaeraceae bacterium]
MKPNHLIYALILSLPIVALYGWHVVGAPSDKLATGFIKGDMPYYVANGRQYFDGDSAGLFYSNPYMYDKQDPIYFQPHLVLFGALAAIMPDTPGLPFAVLGLVFTVAAFWVLIRLVADLCPGASDWQQRFLVFMVAWGGGLLSVFGTLYTLGRGYGFYPLVFDPDYGFWLLNLGRNFIFPTEAFYHLIVLLMLWAVLCGRHWRALVAAAVLALCHPYTGIQYAIILLTWVGLELAFVRSGLFSWKTAWLFALPLIYSLGYYGYYLTLFDSHRELVEQWTLDWSFKLTSIVPAYAIVFAMFIARCSTPDKLRRCFDSPFNRLLGIGAFLSFGMANHEAFITPHQPLHFTRGHIWLPLCLLGLPALLQLWNKFRPRRLFALAVAGLFAILMLCDNMVFFGMQMQKPFGLYTDQSELDVFQFIREQDGKPIVLSEDPQFAYLSATYSQARPYAGHYFNTPNSDIKRSAVEQLFNEKQIPPDLIDQPFWILLSKPTPWLIQDPRFELIYRHNDAAIYRYKARQNSL